jgi:hypothetical protein
MAETRTRAQRAKQSKSYAAGYLAGYSAGIMAAGSAFALGMMVDCPPAYALMMEVARDRISGALDGVADLARAVQGEECDADE